MFYILYPFVFSLQILPRIYASLTLVKISKWKVTTEGYDQRKLTSLKASHDGLYVLNYHQFFKTAKFRKLVPLALSSVRSERFPLWWARYTHLVSVIESFPPSNLMTVIEIVSVTLWFENNFQDDAQCPKQQF
jgi:hypothetical protein